MGIEVALGIGAIASTAIGTGVKAYAAKKQADAQKEAALYKADQYYRNSILAEEQADKAERLASLSVRAGYKEENKFRQAIEEMRGSQKSAYAASGVSVSSGSALETMIDTRRQGEDDALTIRYNAKLQSEEYQDVAKGYRTQAEEYRNAAKFLKEKEYDPGLQIGSTVLTGANQLTQQYFNLSSQGVF
jgi:hypothetical protein